LFGLLNGVLNSVMHFDQGLVHGALSEKLVFVLATAHQEALKSEIDSLVASDFVEACAQGPEEGVTDDSRVLERPLKQELA